MGLFQPLLADTGLANDHVTDEFDDTFKDLFRHLQMLDVS